MPKIGKETLKGSSLDINTTCGKIVVVTTLDGGPEMGLQEDLKPKVKPSQFEIWLSQLQTEDRQALDKAISDPTISTNQILYAVKRNGARVGKDKLVEYRRTHV